MNDLSLYGLETGLVLADLEDLLNLLGSPYPEPEEDNGQGAPSPQNDLQKKMNENNQSDSQQDNAQGGSQNSAKGGQNGSQANKQDGQSKPDGDQSDSAEGAEGGSQGDSQSGQSKDSQGDQKGDQKGEGAGEGKDSDDSQGGGDPIKDFWEKHGGKGAGQAQDNQNDMHQDGRGGESQDNQSGQSGQSGQSQDNMTGQDGEGNGENRDGTNQTSNGQGSDTSGNGSNSQLPSGSARNGQNSNMLDDKVQNPEEGAFFGDDLGESEQDYLKKIKAGRPSWGSGMGSQRKEVDFRGLHVDLDDYAHSQAADIYAMDKNGEDTNETKETKEKLRKLITDAQAQFETNKQLLEAVQEEQEREADREKRMAAMRQGGVTADDIFGRKGSVDWKRWLSKRLAPHMMVTDQSYFGHKAYGGRQAAYSQEGIFFAADEKTKVRNEARIELYFDTSGSISPGDIAIFFREVAQLMNQAKCAIMNTPNGKAAWNNLIKLHIYCWDGSVLCSAPVKTPEELLDIANRTHGGGGTDPNCIFQFKKYNDGLVPLPQTNRSNTGVAYLDNMKNSEYALYLKSREQRLGKKRLRAINNTITIVFTDYGFGAVRKDWLTKHPEWKRMNDPDRCNLLWVCLPNCVRNIKEAREITPFGDICLM